MPCRRAAFVLSLAAAVFPRPAAAIDPGSPAARVLACVTEAARAAERARDPGERAAAEARRAALERLLPAVARATGLPRGEAEAALAAAADRIGTRSLTMDPPGTVAPPPLGCDAIADAPEAYLDGLRR